MASSRLGLLAHISHAHPHLLSAPCGADAPGWKAVYGEIEFEANHFSVFENALDMGEQLAAGAAGWGTRAGSADSPLMPACPTHPASHTRCSAAHIHYLHDDSFGNMVRRGGSCVGCRVGGGRGARWPSLPLPLGAAGFPRCPWL